MINPCAPDYTCSPATRAENRFQYASATAAASPVVTIVTPFWNNAKELFHETARCVLGQSLQPFEWIIVNDQATDPAALAVLDQYRATDGRIRVIDNPVNLGLAGARNVGFKAASTEFVFLLDDDDLIEPTTVEKAYWYLQSHPDCAAASAWVVGFGGQGYLWPRGFEQGEAILKNNVLTSIAMVRRSAWERVGGYDASIRGGMEDWDFWLRLADAGLWGGTISEYLAWYRRRSDHSDRWENLDQDRGMREFQQRLSAKYPRLYAGGFPKIEHWPQSYAEVRPDLPYSSELAKSKQRLLLIVPWLQMGGADKFNLDLVQQLTERGWEISIATTQPGDNCWMPEFARCTPDVFVLQDFLQPVDHPLFLRHLIESRRPDVVMVTNSELGYLLLPYLRSYCPEPAYVDYCHMEEEHWKNGGYPRYAVVSQPWLDLNIVSSQHLKQWMVGRGADAGRIEVAYTNIDPEKWSPSEQERTRTRLELKVPGDVPVILYAARLCPQKQPRVFGRVIERLDQAGLQFQALVAGDGPDRVWLEDYVGEHELSSRVQFLGSRPLTQMRSLMAASDVFFLPSQWEGIALSVYEAMACGLAVVGAEVGGQRELVTPDCGILHPRAEEETEIVQYVDTLTHLLAAPERIRELGRSARSRIRESFTLGDMAERMASLLARAASARRNPIPIEPNWRLETASRAVEYLRVAHLADLLWKARDTLQARVTELDKANQDTWAEAQRLARGWEKQSEYIREVERVKDQVWAELQASVTRNQALEEELERERAGRLLAEGKAHQYLVTRVAQKLRRVLRRLRRLKADRSSSASGDTAGNGAH